jgi:hypothetical protein
MSIIYNTLERLENLEKQEREGHARGDRSRSSNTHAEAHHPVLSTKPGISNAFKIVVFVMLCLGGTAIFHSSIAAFSATVWQWKPSCR